MQESNNSKSELHIETRDIAKNVQEMKAKGITTEMLEQRVEERKKRLLALMANSEDKQSKNTEFNTED